MTAPSDSAADAQTASPPSNDDTTNPAEHWDGQQIPRGPETPPIDPARLPKVYPAVKRALEFPVALAMTVALSPLLIGLTVAAYVGHGYPALFRFPRMGRGKKAFGIFKFRTMVVNAKEQQAAGVPHHELITKYGHFLRKTHMDEVAQILNVLTGDISFVGPRPMDQDTYELLLEENAIWEDILLTRPGITCLESVLADLPELEEKIRTMLKVPPAPSKRLTVSLPRRYPLDRFYIENESLWLDLVIVWYTIRTVAGRGAEHK
jgi:lipopolysaccharide/colanic/teichoic acid biosynthesis glycosyltransferase